MAYDGKFDGLRLRIRRPGETATIRCQLTQDSLRRQEMTGRRIYDIRMRGPILMLDWLRSRVAHKSPLCFEMRIGGKYIGHKTWRCDFVKARPVRRDGLVTVHARFSRHYPMPINVKTIRSLAHEYDYSLGLPQ